MRSQNKKKLIFGVTGSFGSGKTTVTKIFKSFGAQVLDADKLAHGCLTPGTPTYKKIVKSFSKEILKPNRAIDRKKLAAAVFNNGNLLVKLNSIIHPEVIRVIKQRIKQAKSGFIVLDVPLLIESGLHRIADKIIVVKINKQKQIQRIKNRDSISLPEIAKRISFQIPIKKKAKLADFIIDNNGRLKETRKQVAKIIGRLEWKN